MRACELCGKASSTGCGHVSDGSPSDDHCPACGRCWRDECQEPKRGACEHERDGITSACKRCVSAHQEWSGGVKNEFRWTVVYQDAQGRTVHESYRLKASAEREAKLHGGEVYPYGKVPS